MFYDCNIPWTASESGIPRTLNFLHELGYNVVALNYAMTGKIPNELVSADDIPRLRRYTLLTAPVLRDTQSTSIPGPPSQT